MTKMGSRNLEVWLRQPLVNLNEIVRRQNAVAKLVDDTIARDKLRDEGLYTLKGLDLDRLGTQLITYGRIAAEFMNDNGPGISNTRDALQNMYKLHQFADRCLPPLLEALHDLLGDEQDGGEDCALRSAYDGLRKTDAELGQARKLAEHALDMDLAPREFLINKHLCSDLAEVKDELDGIEEEKEMIHEAMNDLWDEASGKGNNQVKIEDTDSNGGTSCAWQFRLISTNDAKLLQSLHGIEVHRILKNGVHFSNKELRELGTKKQDLMAEYQNKQRALVCQVMSPLATYVPILERASSLLAELDVLASFAHVAAYSSSGYCRPEMTDGEEDGLGIEVS